MTIPGVEFEVFFFFDTAVRSYFVSEEQFLILPWVLNPFSETFR